MIDIEAVWPEFSFLTSLGMEAIDGNIDRGGFNNAFLRLKGENFWIILSRDRGDLMVDIGKVPDVTHKIENAIEIIAGIKLSEPVPADMLAKLTLMNWDQLSAGFSDAAWVEKLKIYGQVKAAAWFAGLGTPTQPT